jgi:hypothetical protein
MVKQRMKIGIATLALAGAGVATPLATVTSAGAAAPVVRQHGLVNIVAKNILNGNRVVILKNVETSLAAAVCDVNVNVLSQQLARQGHAFCPALSHNKVVTRVFKA